MANLPLSNWQLALRLKERISFFKLNNGAFTPAITSDLSGASITVERWCKARGFDEFILARRLEVAGVSYREFSDILAGFLPPANKESRWARRFLNAFKSQKPVPGLDCSASDSTTCFAQVIAPLISKIRTHVVRKCERISRTNIDLPISSEIIFDSLLPNIQRHLSHIVNPTLVYELWQAKKKGILTGNTETERFTSFVTALSPAAFVELLGKYPVLARLLIEATDQWITSICEFLERFKEDWASIKEQLLTPLYHGKITHIKVGGDFHENGRAVLIVSFASGCRVVYKPRSVSLLLHFQSLLSWCNSKIPLHFKILKVLEREGYGWCEYIEHTACDSKQSIGRFYERQGSYLALLHFLSATDFHRENVIANGEHPVLIDVETLFQPVNSKATIDGEDNSVFTAISNSVLRTGLLPRHIGIEDGYGGIQVGAIAQQGADKMGKRIPMWLDIGTDNMRMERRTTKLIPAYNEPYLLNEEFIFLQYEDRVLDGFHRMYLILIANKNELLADRGPLTRFTSDIIRILLRNTDFYATILRESYHPSLMRDAIERDMVFDHLWNVTIKRPEMEGAFISECEDLWSGNIPLFYSDMNSCQLRHRSGNNINHFFASSGMEAVRRQLQISNIQELKRQKFFISSSFATSITVDSHLFHGSEFTGHETPDNEVTDALEVAKVLAGRIEEIALVIRGGDLDWAGLRSTQKSRWIIAPAGYDFYNGLSGICMFFAYLGFLAKNEHYTLIAVSALNGIRRHIAAQNISSLGFYEGIGGVIYLYSHLAAIWRDPSLLAEAERMVEKVQEELRVSYSVDVVSGSAGCIGGLISLYKQIKTKRLYETILSCGQKIIDEWTPYANPLSGFSHGGSGIAWALIEIWAMSNEGDFMKKADEILNYEKTLFNSNQNNWEDLRFPSSTHQYRQAWCHGSAGIGLSRIGMLRHLPRQDFVKDICFALRSTKAKWDDSDQSMCHGNGGRMEFILKAYSAGLESDKGAYLFEHSAKFLDRAISHHNSCGTPNCATVPGMMIGLAGIGYQSLRLGFPSKVPSVLLMEPPLDLS